MIEELLKREDEARKLEERIETLDRRACYFETNFTMGANVNMAQDMRKHIGTYKDRVKDLRSWLSCL